MLISRRRLQWSMIGLLGLLAVVLVRPARSYLDAFTAQWIVDSRLSVGKIQIHNRASVLELEDLRWSSASGARRIGFEAPRAWVAVDAEQLVVKQVRCPHIQVEDARLFVQSVDPRAAPELGNQLWQRNLARQVVSLDWEDVRRHVQSLLAARETHQTWSERIGRWVTRSQEILTHIQSLEEASDHSNPLRHEQQLVASLEKVQELSQEQSVLASQFDGIQKLLQSECAHLEQKFESEWAELEKSAMTDESEMSVAHDTLLDVARQYWLLIADYGEISTGMASAWPRYRSQPAYDRDILVSDRQRSLVDLEELTVQGVFQHGDRQTPFGLVADCAIWQDPVTEPTTPQQQSQSRWEYRFVDIDYLIHTHVQKPAESPRRIDIEAWLSLNPRTDVSPSDLPPLPGAPQPADMDDATEPTRIVELQGNLQDGQLTLRMSLSPTILEPMITDLDSLGEFDIPADEEPLRVSVAGAWQQPEFDVDQVPSWFQEVIETQLRSLRQTKHADLQRQAREEFSSQLSKLRALVSQSAEEGSLAASRQQEQTLAVSERLQAALDRIRGTAFARRPGATTNR